MPDIWVLDEKGKPQPMPSFSSIRQEAYAEAERLQRFQSINHDIRSQLFLLIGRLFQSINNRHTAKNLAYGNLRRDGIEVMFFCHFIFWLKHCAPNYHEKDPETLAVYQHFLDYCKEVHAIVITRNSGDLTRNSPSLALDRMIQVLTGHCKALKEIQDAYTFEDYNNQLRNQMLGLASHTFNLIYFLIDKTTEKKLTPQRFLSPQDVEDKLKAIRNTQLGEWLAQTLHMLGITHSTFVPTKKLTSMQINHHLSNQHPEDPVFDKKKILFTWGHRPFVTSDSIFYPKTEKKSFEYLISIRHILKFILEIYFLLQQQTEGAKVNEVHGSVWIYGHRAGKATLLEFLHSVLWVIQALHTEIAAFWEKYYADFQAYAKKNNLTEGNEEFAPLVYINLHIIKLIEELKSNIEHIVDLIKKQIAQFPSDEKIINQSKLVFMRDVLEFRRFINQTSSEEFQILQEEYNRMVKALRLKALDLPEPEEEKSTEIQQEAKPTSILSRMTGHLFIQRQKLIKNQGEAELSISASITHDDTNAEEATSIPNQPIDAASEQKEAEADVIINPLQSAEASTGVVPVPAEQLPLCREMLGLMKIPHYLITVKTSYKPRVNEYCFEFKDGILQYTYLNQQGLEITQPVLCKKDLESLGGTEFKCDEEHFRRYRRELIAIINPKAVARYDYESTLHLNLLKTKPEPFDAVSDKLKFHSKMQEEIYAKFLEEYNNVVNTAEGLTYLRVSNHRLLVDLYQRVNAVFHRLYERTEEKSLPQLTKGELIFIDGLVYHTIIKEFEMHKYYSGFTLTKENLHIDFDYDDERLLIPFNDLVINITREPIQRMIFETVGNMAERDGQIHRLTTDKTVLEEQVAKQD